MPDFDKERVIKDLEVRESRPKVWPNAGDILRLSQRNVIVSQVVKIWQHEPITWEEAMMLAVCELAKQNEKLTTEMLKAAAKETMPYVILKKD